jgi:hypothetical protein
MNVKQLRELLEGHKEDTEIKLGGWVGSPASATSYSYKFESLSEKHFNFDQNHEGNYTICVEVDN